MSEQEYLEMIVAERIQMILADMEAGAVMDGDTVFGHVDLTMLERVHGARVDVDVRIELLLMVSRQAVTEKHLYLAGLKDGIRLLNWGLAD